MIDKCYNLEQIIFIMICTLNIQLAFYLLKIEEAGQVALS